MHPPLQGLHGRSSCLCWELPSQLECAALESVEWDDLPRFGGWCEWSGPRIRGGGHSSCPLPRSAFQSVVTSKHVGFFNDYFSNFMIWCVFVLVCEGLSSSFNVPFWGLMKLPGQSTAISWRRKLHETMWWRFSTRSHRTQLVWGSLAFIFRDTVLVFTKGYYAEINLFLGNIYCDIQKFENFL